MSLAPAVAPRPPGFRGRVLHTRGCVSAGLVGGTYSGGVLVARHADPSADLPALHARAGLHRVGARPGADSCVIVWVAGALPVRRLAAARRAGDRWPLGPDAVLRRAGHGRAALRDLVRRWRLRHDAAVSVHMVQHMILSMLVPLFLALGAPVTLALRTLPPRPRRWLLAVLHSRVAKVLSLPAAGLHAVRGQPVGALLHRLVRRHPALDAPARADARALRPGRLAVLLAAARARPGARAGGLPVPAAADLAHAAVPRVPRRHDHVQRTR